MTQMTLPRKEDLSLYYYIKDVVLSDFVELSEYVPLKFSDVLSTVTNDNDLTTNSYVYEIDIDTSSDVSPSNLGRGWLYLDCAYTGNSCNPYVLTSGTRIDGVPIMGLPEQSSRVIVYDGDGVVIDPSLYMIDYVDCRVVTSGSCLPAYADYYWNYISVIDEWSNIVNTEPPIVVIELKPFKKQGYQLGGGAHVKRSVDLHIFASSSAEKNDILDALYNGLYEKHITIYDFPLGTPLEHDGTWLGRKNNTNKLTSLFDRGINTIPLTVAWFDNVEAKTGNRYEFSTNSVVNLDKFNRYRAKISFQLNYYT